MDTQNRKASKKYQKQWDTQEKRLRIHT